MIYVSGDCRFGWPSWRTPRDFATYQSKNLFGQVEEARDADGLRFFEYDHRGLVIKASHKFWGQNWTNGASNFWTQGAAHDPATPSDDRTTYSTWLSLQHLTNTTTVEISTTYDAAGRLVTVTYPEGMKVRNTYNEGGLLEEVESDRGTGSGWQTIVANARYNARGQVIHYEHGNGVHTDREYDSAIERLLRIHTQLSGATPVDLQDLNYGYDPVGNPVEIEDALTNTSYSANQPVPNTRSFEYDARYRLVRATGKKLASISAKSINPHAPTPASTDYEAYEYKYRYDEVGNFTKNHEYSRGQLHYKDGRIDLFNGDGKEALDDDPALGNFRYDANGNTTRTPRQQQLAYTHDNQPRYIDMGGGTEVRYLRHGDQRVLRFVKKNGVKAVGVYLGAWEYHERDGDVTKTVLHVEGHGRHAQAEVVLNGTDASSLPWFYYHGDHLGSGHILTKDDGVLLSQEEYFPYGRASDRRDTRNRYRYIGVEQDEDTNLCMTGPRTYDPVTGRFFQGDPIAAMDPSWSPYAYSAVRPTTVSDASGYEPAVPESATASPILAYENQVFDPSYKRTDGGSTQQLGLGAPTEGGVRVSVSEEVLRVDIMLSTEKLADHEGLADWMKQVQESTDTALDGSVVFEARGGARLSLDVNVMFVDSAAGQPSSTAPAIIKSLHDSPQDTPHGRFTQTHLPTTSAVDFERIIPHEMSHYLGAADEYGAQFEIGVQSGVFAPATPVGHMGDPSAPVQARSFHMLEEFLSTEVSPTLSSVGLTQFEGPWRAAAP